MTFYVDSQGQNLRPGLYTLQDNPQATIIVSGNGHDGNYRLTSKTATNPDLTPGVARRLRPLSPAEIRALVTDRTETTWLNIQSRRSQDIADAVTKALETL